MAEQVLLKQPCPFCGAMNDLAWPVRGTIHPGTVSICVTCTGVTVVIQGALGLGLRPPTEAELDVIMVDPNVHEVLETIQWMRR